MNHTVRDLVKDQGRSAKQRSLWSVFDRSDHIPNLAKSAEESLRLRFAGTETTVSLIATAPTEPLPHARRFSSAPVVKHAPDYPSSPPTLDECAGSDERMLANIRLVRRLANSSLPFLLLGETGVGKDTLARAIHAESDRRAGPFIAFNCAAIPETLIDSELFGYGSGAFTGARREGNPGRVVEADGGTLFLDEIGDMPPALQTRLLRIIESNEVTPLGSGKARQVNIRIVAATNTDLRKLVKEGTFREDLFYRLNVIPVTLPALRQRREDIPLLAQHFVRKSCTDNNIPLKTVAQDALRALMAYDWPGNIRQFENAIEHAVAMAAAKSEIGADVLPDDVRERAGSMLVPSVAIPDEGVNFTSLVTQLERELILRCLEKTGGNKRQAARLLNLSRTTFIDKLNRLNLERGAA